MYVDRYLNLKSQGSAFDSLSQQEIENIRRRALANNCTDLYTCNFTDEDVDNALKAITPLVAAWAKDGIATIEAPLLHRIRGPFRHEVQGKEDTVWCPMLGIKGNIDMIIATSGDSSRFVTPIELKTGKWRPNTAVAHRAQVKKFSCPLCVALTCIGYTLCVNVAISGAQCTVRRQYCRSFVIVYLCRWENH